MKDSPLTKNGVLMLYDSNSRSTVNVQVVYSMLYHNHFYARLSDGKQLSPLVRFPKLSSNDPPIYVGHVLAVNQAKLMKSDPALEFMMDSALPYLFILAFTVVEQTDSLYGAEVVSEHTSYYPSIKRVSSHLVKFDQSLRALLDREEARGAELSVMGDQMRERGNALFKKGLYKQAAACYESASRLKLYDDRIFSNQSLVCFHLEEFSKALMLAMYAVKLNPFNIKAYYRACQCLEETKEHFQLFVQKRAWRIVCGSSPDMEKFSDREFTTLIPQEMTVFKGPGGGGGGGGRARSQSVAKGQAGTSALSDNKKLPQNDKKAKASEDKTKAAEDKKAKATEDKKAKASEDKKKKTEHARDTSKASEKGSASHKETTAADKKNDPHIADKKKTEEEPVLAPGYSSSGRDFACVSVLKEGRRFYKEAKYDKALDFYRTAVDSGLVRHRPKNEQKRLSFILCLCLVETGSVENCITAVASLKSLLPASPAAAAADDDSDLPRAPVYYLLTMAYHRTWQYAKGTSFAALFNRSLPKDKHRLPLQLPAFVEPIMHTEVIYLEKWYAAKPWLKTDELVVVDTCRYANCELLADTGHHKHIVYSADLYTGHVELACEESCHIFYHPSCWRIIKEQKASDDYFSVNKNKISDKDFLSSPCLTPDCTGSIESVQIFDENKSILQEFIKERSPSEAKPKKKKNKKKNQQNYQNNKSKNDFIAKDNSKSEVSSSENTSKDTQEVPEPIIKKSKGVSMPGSTLPLDELDFESCNVKVIKREPLYTEDIPRKTKKDKKNKKQRALDVERLVPDITDSPSSEQNEYLSKIKRLNAQKEALEKSVDCGSDQDDEDDSDESSDALDPTFYLPSVLQHGPDAVAEFFAGKLDIPSKYSYSREVNIPTPAKLDVLLSFLDDFILNEGPLKWNDREFDSYLKDNLPQESMDYIKRFGGLKEFLNCSPEFVIMDDYVCSREHVGYVQDLVFNDIERDFPAFCISDDYQAKTYLESSPVFHSSSECSLASENAISCPSKLAAKASLKDLIVIDSPVNIEANSGQNVQAEARKPKTSLSETEKSSSSGSVDNVAEARDRDIPANHQPLRLQQQGGPPKKSEQLRQPEQSQLSSGSGSSLERPAPIKKDSSTETESSGLDGGFHTLFNDETNHQKERQLEKQVVKLQRKLDEVLKERNSLKTEAGQLQRKFSDLSHKMGVEVQTLKKQLADAEENVQSRYKLVDQVKADLSTEVRRLNAEKKKLSEENKNLGTKVNALEVREDCLKDEKRTLEQELEHASLSAARQTDQLTMMEASLTSASDRSKSAELGYIDLRSCMMKDMIDRALEFYRSALSRLQELHCRASVVSVPSSTLLQQQTEALQRHLDHLVAEKHKLLGQSDRLRVLINNGRPLNDTMKNSLGTLPDDLLSVNLTDLLALTQDGTVLLSPRAGQYMSGHAATALGSQVPPSAGPYSLSGRRVTIPGSIYESLRNELKLATPRSVVTSVGGDVSVAVHEATMPRAARSATNTPTQLLSEATPSSERQISVGNLPTSISDHQLKALFSRFGEVDAVEMLPALRVAFITFKYKRDCLTVLTEVAAAPLMFGSSVLEVRPVAPRTCDLPDQEHHPTPQTQEGPIASPASTARASPRLSKFNSAIDPSLHATVTPYSDASAVSDVSKAAETASSVPGLSATSVSVLSATRELYMAAGNIPTMSFANQAPKAAASIPVASQFPLAASGLPATPSLGLPAAFAARVPPTLDARVPATHVRVLATPVAGVPVTPVAGVPVTPTAGVPVTPVAGVPVTPTAGVPVTPTAGVLVTPTAGVPVTPTAGVPVTLTAGVPITLTAGVPVTPTAGVPVTPTAGVPATSAEAPFTPAAGVPATLAAAVPARLGAGASTTLAAQAPTVPTAFAARYAEGGKFDLSLANKSVGNTEAPVSAVKLTPVSAVKQAPMSAVKQAPMSAVKQVPMSAVKQTPMSAVKQTPMSAVKQVPMSAVKQVPTSAVKQVPTSSVIVVNSTAASTNKTSAAPNPSLLKTINGIASANSSNSHTAARTSSRTPTQMSVVQSRLSSPACAPSPSHDHSQLSYFGVKPKVTAPVAASGTVSAFATNRANARPAVKASDMAGKKSHERLADICQAKFGSNYSREAILEAIYQVRCSNNNRLSGLAEDVIIERVRQLVRPSRSKSNITSIAPWANAALAKPAIQATKKVKEYKHDECCVCITVMHSSDKTKSLDCGHVFHEKCINNWLNVKRECPFCRYHNVDKEEYPPLSSSNKH